MLVGLTDGLVVALLVVALVTCGVLIYALIEAIGALRSLRGLSDELMRTVPPLIEKADVAIEALSAQLLRADLIITDLEATVDRVRHATETVQDAVNAPAVAMNAAGERLREAWNRRKRARG